MRDDDGAAGIIGQRVLERAQSLDVEIVGGLVEQQQIGACLEHFGEMDAVALAARELAHLLLLIGALEVEGAGIGARIDLALAEIDDLVAAGNLLPDVLLGVERVARLIDIADRLTESPTCDRSPCRAFPGR